MQTAISITTINIPTVLDGLTKNITEHGHTKDVFIVVTGDEKTPEAISVYMHEVAKATGVNMTYMSLDDQNKWLAANEFRQLLSYLPNNSLGRRNVGDLFAYKTGADVIIRLDDDNECIERTGDFVGGHLHNLRLKPPMRPKADKPVTFYDALDNFHGPCAGLRHRGWPLGATECTKWNLGGVGRCVVSESFCIGEPDLDAIWRLDHLKAGLDKDCRQRHSLSFKASKETYQLEPGVWHPINTQATAFHRDIMPAAFVNPHLKRYDDIWMGYVVRAVSDMMGWGATCGGPVVGHFQWRSRASVLRDVADELHGMEHTPAFVARLEEWKRNAAGADGDGDVNRLVRSLGGLYPDFPEVATGLMIWLDTLEHV
jgi:hypothetical protein